MTDGFLQTEEKSRYIGLLEDAFAAAELFDGSEDAINLIVETGVPVEDMAKSKLPEEAGMLLDHELAAATDALMHDLAVQAGFSPELAAHAGGSGLIDYATQCNEKRLLEKAASGNLLDHLKSLGVAVDLVRRPYVRPEKRDEPPIQAGSGAGFEIKEHKRLALLMAHLHEIGVYPKDIEIHIGTVNEGEMRQAPYILVNIPKLDRQVAVCDQVGEVTFVARTILPPGLWTTQKKHELEMLPDVTTVIFHHGDEQKWVGAVLNMLGGEWAKAKVRNQHAFALSPEFIMHHRLLHLREHGAWPSQNDPVETVPEETWCAWETAADKGTRGLPEGGPTLAEMSLRWVVRRAWEYKFYSNGITPDAQSGPILGQDAPEGLEWSYVFSALERTNDQSRAVLRDAFVKTGLWNGAAGDSVPGFVVASALNHLATPPHRFATQKMGAIQGAQKRTWSGLDAECRGKYGQGTTEIFMNWLADRALAWKKIHGKAPDGEDVVIGGSPEGEHVTWAMVKTAVENGGSYSVSLWRTSLARKGVIAYTSRPAKGDIALSMLHCIADHGAFPSSRSPLPVDGQDTRSWNDMDKLCLINHGKTLSSLFCDLLREQAAIQMQATGERIVSGALRSYPFITWEEIDAALQSKSTHTTSVEKAIAGVADEVFGAVAPVSALQAPEPAAMR